MACPNFPIQTIDHARAVLVQESAEGRRGDMTGTCRSSCWNHPALHGLLSERADVTSIFPDRLSCVPDVSDLAATGWSFGSLRELDWSWRAH